jgi:CRP-like cAMP-binding protein
MDRANRSEAAVENRLLAALPGSAYERLLPALEPVSLSLRQTIYEAEQPIEYVYFVRVGVISMVSVMQDGTIIEVATVGNEGMVGLPVFLGADTIAMHAFVQIPGAAMRMKATALREEVRNGGALAALLQRYTQALLIQIAQGAACNRVHSIEERCARWLLMTHDRVGADEFPLTQKFLSQMLGARRASVNRAARVLQQAGFIRYRRGQITILDREGLESAACECYTVIKREYERLYA